MEKIVEALKILGLSENESKVYMHLLKNPGDNGTQISKILTISRSAIYTALESLEKKKIIKLLPSDEDRKNYEVFNPEIFLMDKENELDNVLKYLKNELNSMYVKYNNEQIHLITNSENYKYIVLEILKTSKEKILISGKIDEFLKDNIQECDILQFKNIDDKEKLIILSDDKKLLIKDDFSIIYTKNKSLINIMKSKLETEK